LTFCHFYANINLVIKKINMIHTSETTPLQFQFRRERIAHEKLQPIYTTRRERRTSEGHVRADDINAQPVSYHSWRENRSSFDDQMGLDHTETERLIAEQKAFDTEQLQRSNVIVLNDYRREQIPLSEEMLVKQAHASEFIDLNDTTLQGHIENRERFSLPIYSLVNSEGVLLAPIIEGSSTALDLGRMYLNDTMSKNISKPVELTYQLEIQREVIESYRRDLNNGNIETIKYLDDMWSEMQVDKEVEVSIAQPRLKKFGSFISSMFMKRPESILPPQNNSELAIHKAAVRQHWMNQEVAAHLIRVPAKEKRAA
jgi:hypothetical protein